MEKAIKPTAPAAPTPKPEVAQNGATTRTTRKLSANANVTTRTTRKLSANANVTLRSTH